MKIGIKYIALVLAIAVLAIVGAWAISGRFTQSGELKIIGETDGNFKIVNRDVCYEDGKPIVYFFGHSGCPHCRWEHPLVVDVANNFSGYISFHDNFNYDADNDVFRSYQAINPGYIPFTVLGCKYVKVGSGEQIGEDAEIAALTKLMCDLTDNKPIETCS